MILCCEGRWEACGPSILTSNNPNRAADSCSSCCLSNPSMSNAFGFTLYPLLLAPYDSRKIYIVATTCTTN
ncbi:hypothetical protein A0H81_03429 [Grifola frondosa]|uniref:Uncharacterized protein n=1 Tax=Grifola frondosa TaxID=5627 RepID=A0A1C7MJM8_GRIFR|nr:hypothetical protein A0H81_03429 [Grifola frondosa]